MKKGWFYDDYFYRLPVWAAILIIAIKTVGVINQHELNKSRKVVLSQPQEEIERLNPNILITSTSPNKKYKYYIYQHDQGGFGTSTLYYSVAKTDELNPNYLESGRIPHGYKIIKWTEQNELVLERTTPNNGISPSNDLQGKSEINGIKVKIIN